MTISLFHSVYLTFHGLELRMGSSLSYMSEGSHSLGMIDYENCIYKIIAKGENKFLNLDSSGVMKSIPTNLRVTNFICSNSFCLFITLF